MSSYIPGITDYLPQITPFRPDLNYYSNILSTKQGQYDAAHKQLSGMYGTLLNSPMSHDENIQRRDKFFTMIDQSLKKVSGLDLSLEQNVNAANQVFKPLYEDKYIAKDMAFTRQAQNAYQRGEGFRNCVDPDKCGGAYWDAGMKKINYQVEEFKKSNLKDTLGLQAPTYTPFHNLTAKAIKAAKDSGLEISVDSQHGGYMVKDTNGSLLLGEKGKNNGILPNYLLGLFKDDQGIKDVFNTQAYVARKDWSKAHAGEFGGNEDAAESEYIKQIISSEVPKIAKQAEQSKAVYDDLDNRSKVLYAKTGGKVIPGSPEASAHDLLTKLLQSKPAVDAHHEEVQNLVQTAKNLEDIHQLRARADAIVANSGFQTTINNAAQEYAIGTQKREMKADPFALQAAGAAQSLHNSLILQDHAADIQMQKENYKTKQMQAHLAGLGLDPSLAIGLDNKGFQDLIQRVGGKDANTLHNVDAFAPSGGGTTMSTTQRNEKILDGVHAQFQAQAGSYLTAAAVAMKNHYDMLKNNQSNTATQNKMSIVSQMKDLFGGTGFNVDGFLQGTVNANDIQKINKTTLSKKYETLLDIKDDVTRYSDWQNNLADKQSLKADLEKNRQVITKLTDLKIQGAKAAITSVLAGIASEGGNANDIAAAAVLLDKNGNQRDVMSAAKLYADRTANSFSGRGQDPYKMAMVDFIQRYSGLKQKYDDAYPVSYQGKYGVGNEGGTLGVEKAKRYVADVEHDLSKGTSGATDIANVITQNAENPAVAFYSGTVVDPHDVSNDPTIKQFAKQYFALYKGELGKKSHATSHNFEVDALASPEMQFSGDVFPAANYYKVTPNILAVKQIEGKNFVPGKDYSFTVKVPDELDNSAFKESVQPSATNMILNQEGGALTVGDKKRGMITINKGGQGSYYLSGHLEAFNKETGEYYQKPINNMPVSGIINADDAWKFADDLLTTSYQGKQNFEQVYKQHHAGK